MKTLALILVIVTLIWYSNGAKLSKVEVAGKALSSMVNILYEQQYSRTIKIFVVGEDEKLLQIANKIMLKSQIPTTLKFWRNQTAEIVGDSLMIILHNSFKKWFLLPPMMAREIFNAKIIDYDITDERTRNFSKISNENFDSSFQLRHSSNDDSMYFYRILYHQDLSGNCIQEYKRTNTFHTAKNSSWEHKNFVQNIEKDNCKFSIYHPPLDSAGAYHQYTEEYLLIYYKNFLFEFSNRYGNELESIKEKNDFIKVQLLISFLPTNRLGKALEYTALSPPIFYDHFTFMVTRGRSYTPMEKMFLAFDDWTWILIVLTFIVGYLTILVTYQCTREVQQFVFGSENREPSLTLAKIFFGVGTSRVPHRNFARFLFMAFTLYCLVIRTAYQGKMFEFMTSDVRYPTARTVQEMRDMNVPILIWEEQILERFLKNEPLARLVSGTEFDDIGDQYQKYENQTFAHMVWRFVSDKLYGSDSDDENKQATNLSLIDDNYDELSIAFAYFNKATSYVRDALETFIWRCHEHGLMKQFKPKGKKYQIIKAEPEDPRKVLTMQMLSAGFYVWLGAVVLSCIAFIGEHLVFWIQTRKDKKITKCGQNRRNVEDNEKFDFEDQSNENEGNLESGLENIIEIDIDEEDKESHHEVHKTVTADVEICKEANEEQTEEISQSEDLMNPQEAIEDIEEILSISSKEN